MDKLIIWGTGNDYDKIINQVIFEEQKRNLKVAALVSKKKDIVGKCKDGWPVISKSELTDIDYDYIVIASDKFFDEIFTETTELGIPRSKIINGKIFQKPLFDYSRYISLKKNPITILSDDCWGGFVYHDWGLPFTSPCINILWHQDSYTKFIQDPLYYFEQPLILESEGDYRKNIWPVGKIGNGDKEIKLDFIHSPNFKHAEERWNRRKLRINPERIFVKMGFDATEEKSEEYLEVFDKIKYNKICFYSGETDKKDIVYLKSFDNYCNNYKGVGQISYNAYCRKISVTNKNLDVLKMLNGEKDFIRDN